MFIPKTSQKFATSPSLALVCYWLYKKGQPIGATVHSHCIENFEGLLQLYVVEGGVAMNCEKTQFFLNTLYLLPPSDTPTLLVAFDRL